jgi:putative hydrolase of the HAD superfamily
MSIRLICLDADDTLWGHESYFQQAARRYADLLAPHVAAAVASERLAAIEDQNLHVYGYGVKGFILSMLETALEIVGDSLPASTTREILAIGRDLMRHPIALLPGVAEAMGPLSARAPLALVTKGDLFHQEFKLAASGLGEFFSSVDVVSEKTPEQYLRVFARHGVAPEEAVMAGNSMRSDIWPTLQADAYAVHIPHEFEWARERADEPPADPRFHRLTSLAELPAWIDRLNATG